ncbi:MAG: sugar ABC transporter ATP-binding protein [Anaerolineae bacterium]
MALLEARDIVKTYPGVRALDHVDFILERAQIHALVGMNGAGKSTLVKIIAGVEKPDHGSIFLDGQLLHLSHARDAAQHGIVVVHQERTLIRHLSVAENILLGIEPSQLGIIDNQLLRQRARELLENLGISDLDIDADVEKLGAGKQQLVDIARALRTSPKVIVLDEPTASLSAGETEHLFDTLRRFKERNVGIIFVSHHLDEVFEIADHITILRDGKVVSAGSITAYKPEDVPRLIVGHEIAETTSGYVDATGKPILLEVQHLSGEGFYDVSLKVHAGEVVGLAGVVGAGRTELLESLVGYRNVQSGTILIRGEPKRIRNPQQAIRHGLILVPEKRMEKGLLMRLDVLENLTVACLPRYSPGGVVSEYGLRQAANSVVKRLGIVTPSLRTNIGNLSGGNKQKVVFGKWLAASENVQGKIFLLDEPTEGIDVGARAEMWNIIRRLAAQGAGVVVATSDLEELMVLADRIYIMRAGRMVCSGRRPDFTQETVLQHMLGATEAVVA